MVYGGDGLGAVGCSTCSGLGYRLGGGVVAPDRKEGVIFFSGILVVKSASVAMVVRGTLRR